MNKSQSSTGRYRRVGRKHPLLAFGKLVTAPDSNLNENVCESFALELIVDGTFADSDTPQRLKSRTSNDLSLKAGDNYRKV